MIFSSSIGPDNRQQLMLLRQALPAESDYIDAIWREREPQQPPAASKKGWPYAPVVQQPPATSSSQAIRLVATSERKKK